MEDDLKEALDLYEGPFIEFGADLPQLTEAFYVRMPGLLVLEENFLVEREELWVCCPRLMEYREQMQNLHRAFRALWDASRTNIIQPQPFAWRGLPIPDGELEMSIAIIFSDRPVGAPSTEDLF